MVRLADVPEAERNDRPFRPGDEDYRVIPAELR
jgi:hypothetical protein